MSAAEQDSILEKVERCGATVTDDGRCSRRRAHHGHCAVGGSYALALDERDDARDQLRGAVSLDALLSEDAAQAAHEAYLTGDVRDAPRAAFRAAGGR